MSRTLPSRLLGQNVREAVLDEADALLARFGYARFTVEALAQAVGIGKGTIYLYFRSKEEVALSVIDRVVYRVESALAAIAHSDAAVPERLHAMLVTRVLGRFDSFAHYQGSLSELVGVLRPALHARREQVADREAALFARVIAEGLRAGALGPRKPQETARLLMLGTDALMPSNLSMREIGDRASVEKRVRALATVLVDGVRAQSRDKRSAARRHRRSMAATRVSVR